MAWLTGFVLIVSVTMVTALQRCSGASGHDEFERKCKIIAREMENMRIEMEVMRNSLNRMERISRDVGAAYQDVCEVSEDNLIESKEVFKCDPREEEEDDFDTPVYATSVKTKGNTFVLKYHSKSKARVDMLNGNLDSMPLNGSAELSHSFSCGTGVVSGPAFVKDSRVTFRVDDYSTSVHFRFSNDREVTLPPLKITTDGRDEIIFEPGSSVEVKIKVKDMTSGGYDVFLDHAMKMYVVSRNETETVVTVREFVNTLQIVEYETYTEYTFTINENKTDYEGMVVFYPFILNLNSTGTHLSSALPMNVRRSDHMTPFPEGFLGFLKDHDHRFKTCTQGSTCLISASIFGNDPEDVTLWRIVGNRNDHFTGESMKEQSKNKVKVWFLLRNVTDSDKGRYMYRGTSQSGKVIEKEFEIVV